MISVCMATYNGEKYIREQIQSIIVQLSKDDELIISDDGSSDQTVAIAQSYISSFPNIRIIQGPCQGVIRNFENAISHAKGEIIFLSDQDDTWEPNKVKTVMPYFQDPNCFVVVHDASIVDGEANVLEPSFYAHRGSQAGLVKNLVKNSYLGCCMAFRSTMCSSILPFPPKIEMHDWWIGLISEIGNHSVFIPDCLLKYRRHGENVSSFHHHPIRKMIYNRMYFCYHLPLRILQIEKIKSFKNDIKKPIGKRKSEEQ